MNPQSVILLMISAWLLVAAAALWGMLRIVHRHHRDMVEQHMLQQEPPQQPAPAPAARKAPRKVARHHRHPPHKPAHA